jgi:hypothetical protein
MEVEDRMFIRPSKNYAHAEGRGREFVRWRGEERKRCAVMGWIDRGYGCVVEGMDGWTDE